MSRPKQYAKRNQKLKKSSVLLFPGSSLGANGSGSCTRRYVTRPFEEVELHASRESMLTAQSAVANSTGGHPRRKGVLHAAILSVTRSRRRSYLQYNYLTLHLWSWLFFVVAVLGRIPRSIDDDGWRPCFKSPKWPKAIKLRIWLTKNNN